MHKERSVIENQGPNVFIDGKNQIIEMLKHMSPQHRKNLLSNIRLKNPSLAKELTTSGLDFSIIGELNDQDICKIFSHVEAPVFGIALRKMNKSFQKYILSLAPRNYAESVYKVMIKRIEKEDILIKRAQKKIVDLISVLNRKQIINLQG